MVLWCSNGLLFYLFFSEDKENDRLNSEEYNKSNKDFEETNKGKLQAAEKQVEPEEIYCTISQEEVPPVPSNNFLMRQTMRSDQNDSGRNETRDRDTRRNGRQRDAEGRKVKGRGALVRFLNINQ